MVLPEFVLRGFSCEPSACCGCLTSNKPYLVVGLSDGSLELWNISATYRQVYRSPGSLFSSKSPVLCVREIMQLAPGQSMIAAESKIHEIVFCKISPDNIVQLFSINVAPDAIAPSFCQFDSVNSNKILARSGQESSLILSTIEETSYKDIISLTGPQQLGKTGEPMFVKLISPNNSTLIRLLCGFESSHIVLWSVNCGDQSISCNVLYTFLLTSLFEKGNEQDMEMCPTCADSAFPSGDKRKPVFLIVGSTSNIIFKISLNDDLTNFSVTMTRTPSKGVTAVRIRPSDQKLAAIGFSDGSICLVSPKSLSILGTLSHHRQPSPIGSRSISALDFVNTTLNSKWLLAASCRDKTVSLWDIYNEK